MNRRCLTRLEYKTSRTCSGSGNATGSTLLLHKGTILKGTILKGTVPSTLLYVGIVLELFDTTT